MRVEKSFLKWVGSKNRLIPQLLPHMPSSQRLIEPFVGAGNVFINTNYDSYILADKNCDLVNVYRWARDDVQQLMCAAQSLFDSDVDYYDVRSQFNSGAANEFSLSRAAQFLYLNRHSFNGICRYNRRGEFNTPAGSHKNVYFPRDELLAFSEKLRSVPVSILDDDFRYTIALAYAGDVVYCDPPYVARSKNGIFSNYTPSGFDISTTEVLHDLLVAAVLRGATAIVSNSNNSIVREIFCDFEIHEIDAPRSVAANGNRQLAKEIIGVLTPDMV
jgi:DNA adenine methylase